MNYSASNAACFTPALFLALLGCSKPANVGSVSGTVSFQGEPVPAGNIIYFEQSSKGYLAVSEIGENGSYTLNYQRTPDIPLGDYAVYVGPPESNMTQTEYYALKKKVDAEFRSRGEQPPPSPDWTLPAKFYAPTTSPLSATVEAGENDIPISLEE